MESNNFDLLIGFRLIVLIYVYFVVCGGNWYLLCIYNFLGIILGVLYLLYVIYLIILLDIIFVF